MKFKIFKEYGALNSPPVFSAFEQGIKKIGCQIVSTDEDAAVIWSVLWLGRMAKNKEIYEFYKNQNKPVFIIEVGNFKRGSTWRISEGNVNSQGNFGNIFDLDLDRPKKLGINLKDYSKTKKESILITLQHYKSLQWAHQPSTEKWISQTIEKIRCFSDRKIVIRPHPRCPFNISTIKNAEFDRPLKVSGTYDDFNIDYDHHFVINHNSGPTIQAAINGTPIICHESSLAYPCSDQFSNIENPIVPDRDDWLIRLCHTEWSLEEISNGIPVKRIIKTLT